MISGKFHFGFTTFRVSGLGEKSNFNQNNIELRGSIFARKVFLKCDLLGTWGGGSNIFLIYVEESRSS